MLREMIRRLFGFNRSGPMTASGVMNRLDPSQQARTLNPQNLPRRPAGVGAASGQTRTSSRLRVVHSALMLAALMSGHHFSISAF
jgi:hypothetical protein